MTDATEREKDWAEVVNLRAQVARLNQRNRELEQVLGGDDAKLLDELHARRGEVVRLEQEAGRLAGMLRQLRDEVSPLAIAAVREGCGVTQAAMLQLRVDQADMLLRDHEDRKGHRLVAPAEGAP